MHFKLVKWYFDCVDQEGRVFIGYAAKVGLGIIRFHYGAVILAGADAATGRQKQTLTFGRLEEDGDSLRWTSRNLAVDGTWKGQGGGQENVLYASAKGKIVWQCLKPNALVKLRLRGQSLEGRGYAEKLTLTLLPWELPFHELRWGRFISDHSDDFAVWIDWKGELNKSWVWTSQGCWPGEITDEGVRFEQSQLQLDAPRLIRVGNVAGSLLGHFHLLSRLLPSRLRTMQEKKYYSCGRCWKGQDQQLEGYAIHEVITWS